MNILITLALITSWPTYDASAILNQIVYTLPTETNCASQPMGVDPKRNDWPCETNSNTSCRIKVWTTVGDVFTVHKDCDGHPIATYDSCADEITYNGTKTDLYDGQYPWPEEWTPPFAWGVIPERDLSPSGLLW